LHDVSFFQERFRRPQSAVVPVPVRTFRKWLPIRNASVAEQDRVFAKCNLHISGNRVETRTGAHSGAIRPLIPI
jgi:hypothetical protein